MPLDNLHDVIIPSTVSWWPLSLSAFALIAITIGVLILTSYVIVKQKRFKRAKKEAINKSKQLLTVNLENTQALHLLLKRLVKHYYSKPLLIKSISSGVNNLRWSPTSQSTKLNWLICIKHNPINS